MTAWVLVFKYNKEEAIKENGEILDTVQNFYDPPKSLDAQKSFGPPSPYQSLGILTLKVWKYEINFQRILIIKEIKVFL